MKNPSLILHDGLWKEPKDQPQLKSAFDCIRFPKHNRLFQLLLLGAVVTFLFNSKPIKLQSFLGLTQVLKNALKSDIGQKYSKHLMPHATEGLNVS